MDTPQGWPLMASGGPMGCGDTLRGDPLDCGSIQWAAAIPLVRRKPLSRGGGSELLVFQQQG